MSSPKPTTPCCAAAPSAFTSCCSNISWMPPRAQTATNRPCTVQPTPPCHQKGRSYQQSSGRSFKGWVGTCHKPALKTATTASPPSPKIQLLMTTSGRSIATTISVSTRPGQAVSKSLKQKVSTWTHPKTCEYCMLQQARVFLHRTASQHCQPWIKAHAALNPAFIKCSYVCVCVCLSYDRMAKVLLSHVVSCCVAAAGAVLPTSAMIATRASCGSSRTRSVVLPFPQTPGACLHKCVRHCQMWTVRASFKASLLCTVATLLVEAVHSRAQTPALRLASTICAPGAVSACGHSSTQQTTSTLINGLAGWPRWLSSTLNTYPTHSLWCTGRVVLTPSPRQNTPPTHRACA